MSALGSAVLARLASLESAIFGWSLPGATTGAARLQNYIIPLAGTTDALAAFAIYIVNSASADAMTLAAPAPGGPGVGQDGQILTVFDAGGHAHTITTPANAINGSKHVVTFNGTLGSFIDLLAYGGGFYMLANSGVSLS